MPGDVLVQCEVKHLLQNVCSFYEELAVLQHYVVYEGYSVR